MATNKQNDSPGINWMKYLFPAKPVSKNTHFFFWVLKNLMLAFLLLI